MPAQTFLQNIASCAALCVQLGLHPNLAVSTRQRSISISGLVVEYIVAIDVTRVRFPADAFLGVLAFGARVGVGFRLLASLGSFCASTRPEPLANSDGPTLTAASIAQLVEHALRKRMVVGSIPTGGLLSILLRQHMLDMAHARACPSNAFKSRSG